MQCVAVCCSGLDIEVCGMTNTKGVPTPLCPSVLRIWRLLGVCACRSCSSLSDCLLCSVLQSVAVRYSVLQCVVLYCRVLRCAAVCCGVLQCAAVCGRALQCVTVCCGVLQCVAVCCSVLQCVAVRCSLIQCRSCSSLSDSLL